MGRCKRGDACWFLHVGQSGEEAKPPDMGLEGAQLPLKKPTEAGSGFGSLPGMTPSAPTPPAAVSDAAADPTADGSGGGDSALAAAEDDAVAAEDGTAAADAVTAAADSNGNGIGDAVSDDAAGVAADAAELAPAEPMDLAVDVPEGELQCEVSGEGAENGGVPSGVDGDAAMGLEDDMANACQVLSASWSKRVAQGKLQYGLWGLKESCLGFSCWVG